MERDVYNVLLEKLSEIKEVISSAVELASDVETLQGSVSTLQEDVTELQGDVGDIETLIGNFKIETYSGTLDNTSDTNIFNTGITYTNYAIVGISINNVVRATTADALVNYTFSNLGVLTLTKANASWGGTNDIKVTVIHD